MVQRTLWRPNGLPLSRRERWESLPKKNDLVREAVGYSGVFGIPIEFADVPPACANHTILGSRAA